LSLEGLDALAAAIGADRIEHDAGKFDVRRHDYWALSHVRDFVGTPAPRPGALVRPRSVAEVQAVLAFANQRRVAVIPFGLTGISLKPVVAQAGFLPPETPLFEIRDANKNQAKRGVLVLNADLGDALAKTLGANPVVLMRGHGETVVGRSVREATVRTLYTHIDAQAQSAALALGPHITVLDAAELATNAAENFDADRPWQNYKQRLPAGR